MSCAIRTGVRAGEMVALVGHPAWAKTLRILGGLDVRARAGGGGGPVISAMKDRALVGFRNRHLDSCASSIITARVRRARERRNADGIAGGANRPAGAAVAFDRGAAGG
jgi:hypothetical protein